MPIPQTRDFAVKFGRQPDMGLEGLKAFPFIFTFVNSNNVDWQAQTGQFATLAAAEANLSTFAPRVEANSLRTINVMLDPDYNFKLLAIRYSVYTYDSRLQTIPWYVDTITTAGAGGLSEGMNPDENWIGNSLTNYVRVTLSYSGSGSIVQYGGNALNPVPNQYDVNGRLPLPLAVAQGYEAGFTPIRTPYLLPRQGCMVFDVKNDYSQPVFVAAAIYGMKIRM